MPANDMTQTNKTSAHHLCWSCRQDIGSGPFCKHCVKIQPIEELGNYYTLFGLRKSFDIDPVDLKKRFLELSRRFHPDFFSSKVDEEKILARNNTAYLNNALNVLSDPVRRAEYLMTLHAGNYASDPAPPHELFEEILEAGELLDQENLTDGDREMLIRAKDKFSHQRKELIESLYDLFPEFLNGNVGVKKEIAVCLNQIKYLRTITARIIAALVKKDDNE